MSLEGKELEGSIGKIGTYSVDLTPKGVVEVSVGVKIDILAELKKLAKRSDNKIDDAAVAIIEKLLG